MTDQQTYTNSEGRSLLTIDREETLAADLTITLHGRDWSSIPAYALLAMIDAIAPDAMRGYLRERSDLMDSPDESCSTLEGMLPADLAAEAARFREVPEADSPEEVDEHPDAVQEFASMLIDRLDEFRAAAETSQHLRDCASFAVGVLKGATL